MENPATWGDAENIINNAIVQHHYATQNGTTGLSLPRTITDALRNAGLLRDHPENPRGPATEKNIDDQPAPTAEDWLRIHPQDRHPEGGIT